MDFLARMTTSQPGTSSGSNGRITSRSNRFAWLRFTAFPNDRPAEMANIVFPRSLGRITNTTSGWA